MSEVAWFRGRGGGLHCYTLPLTSAFAAQEAKGFLVRVEVVEEPPAPVVEDVPVVEPDAPEFDDEDETPPSLHKPKQVESKATWVAWAVLVSGLTEAEANAMTKAELIDQFG